MPQRALKNLRNLGNHGKPNTKRTALQKLQGIFSNQIPKHRRAPGKENQDVNNRETNDASNVSDTRLSMDIDSAQTEMRSRNSTDELEDAPLISRSESSLSISTTMSNEVSDLSHEMDVQGSSDSTEKSGPPSWVRQPLRGVGTAWEDRKPPTEQQAAAALEKVNKIVKPRRENYENRKVYKKSEYKGWSLGVLQEIKSMLNLFTGAKSKSRGKWTESSRQAAYAQGKQSKYAAEKIRENTKKFILKGDIPTVPFGTWIKGEDREVREQFGLKKPIARSTAQCWMRRLGYRWARRHRGLYFDGHERDDVVDYRQKVFLPMWFTHWPHMQKWDKNGNEEVLELPVGQRRVVPWFHDETIFYGNDRRESCWVQEAASAAPMAKGEGASEMFGEFFSPDFGFLKSKDGLRSARVIWKPGKNRDGYFDNDDFLDQVNDAMDILESDYPDIFHLLIFDNAPSHMKRPEDAVSARKMPKKTPADGKNWGVDVPKRGSDGKVIRGSDGKPIKIKVRMRDACFNGKAQSLYFPDGHPRAGVFKGMALILKERGYHNADKLLAQCKGFKCPPEKRGRCCCRRILFNEPDFVNVKTKLEELCERRGFLCLILPKYHCELNPIEMIWGRSKYHYRLNLPSTLEEDLHRNALAALESVTVEEMRRFSNRSYRFMNAYSRGLDGRQAAWANKKYHGHRVLPETLMQDMDDAGIH